MIVHSYQPIWIERDVSCIKVAFHGKDKVSNVHLKTVVLLIF